MDVISKGEVCPEGFEKKVESTTIERLRGIMRRGLIVSTEVYQVVSRADEDGDSILAWRLDLDGVVGIVPFEESGLEHKAQMSQFAGRKIHVKIIKIIPNPQYALCSRKLAIEEMANTLFKKVHPGQILKGVVHGVGDNHVYVDIGGYTGKIERKDATRSKVFVSLRRFFTVGEQVDVKVMEVDCDKREISLSIVGATPDPWLTAKIKKGDIVVCRVTNVITQDKNNVAFAEVQPGLDAIVTVPAKNVSLKVGDRIQARVTKFDPDNRKFRVRMIQKIK